MHQQQTNKTYAVDVETVSQGKRAIEYTNGKDYKLGNVKDPKKIEAKLLEKKEEARQKHGLNWWTGKIISIGFVDVFGNDPDVCFYGYDEFEILTKAYDFLNGSKLIAKSGITFDYPFLVGRFMANDFAKIPFSLRTRSLQYDVDNFFGWSSASGQRGSLSDYSQGIGFKEKPLTGNMVQGIYDTAVDAKMQNDSVAEKAAWKEITDYNLHDCKAVKAIARAYYGNEGIN